MRHKFVDYFSKISPLSEEEAKAIEDNMLLKTYKKGEYLVRAGQVNLNTFFIMEGCVREFILVDGEEKTTHFYTEEQWVISLNNFNTNLPSINNLECMEDTVVSIGNEEQAQKMFKAFPRFETIARAIIESDFAEQKKQLISYHTDSPEQRYLKLLKQRPDIFQRVPQYHIASYIGVKPESLSRIRKRIAEQGEGNV